MTAHLVATRAMAKRLLNHTRADVPEWAPVFRAAMAGWIVVHMSERGDGPVPLAELDALGKPALVMLLDSTPPAAGPDGWPGLAEALTWSATTFPAAGGLPRAAYDALVQEVMLHRRFLWVDTTAGLLPAWTRAMGGRPEALEVV